MLPHSSDAQFANDADRAACRAMIRAGSKSFSTAALLLPKSVREPAYALYAFCRLSDDMVDIDGGCLDAIARLRERLALAYEGCPANSSVDRAFADVIRQFAIPRVLPDALIDGLECDVEGVVCETLSDVYAYAARVAGAVGAMMAVLMGKRDPDIVARACDLGVAMQLTNIARDVGEDARSGRLYLPREWLREEGVDPDTWLASPHWLPEICIVTRRLLDQADKLYALSERGIAGLPLSCRSGIFAARHLYHAIGTEVARNAFDSVTRRARVSGAKKIGLMGRALVSAAHVQLPLRAEPALAETQYLVDGVASTNAPQLVRGVSNRVLWVAGLFASLRERDRMMGVRT